MKLTFAKFQGLGNDFIVVHAENDSVISPLQATALCDRHFGVGADGVLLVTKPRSEFGTASMVVLNADGSRPEMCGNGLRCVALSVAIRESAGDVSYLIDTDAGPLLCEVERDGDRAQVKNGMGRGRPEGERVVAAEGRELSLSLVSMGNPHAVAFDTGLDEPALDRIAPRISALFPSGCNIELATLRDSTSIDLVVWERGVGRTLACGTGAAATVVAAALSGRSPFDRPVQVRLPGGPLEVTCARDSFEVTLRGPAERVFSGQLEIA